MRPIAVLIALASLVPSAAPAAVDLPLPLVRLTQIATLSEPIALVPRNGDTSLYIAQKHGVVRAIRGGSVDPAPVLDISALTDSNGEQGLLGLAFSPIGDRIYVNYTDLPGGDTRIDEYQMNGGIAVPSSRRQILTVDQPYPNHNGGDMSFGPDGFLYIALGDGGSGGDPHDHGQRLDSLLGKILRINPLAGAPYAIPPGNPFVGVAGARPEIWSYGLRNPWRFSFDRATGAMWIGDVGQNLWEEIDFEPAGAGGRNYGWNRFEGTHTYNTSRPAIANHTPPVYEYPHDGQSCSVTGGFVYRGSRVPAMHGNYVFADFCAGRLTMLLPVLGIYLPIDLNAAASWISSFGQDAAGELYVLSLGGGVFRIDPLI